MQEPRASGIMQETKSLATIEAAPIPPRAKSQNRRQRRDQLQAILEESDDGARRLREYFQKLKSPTAWDAYEAAALPMLIVRLEYPGQD
jgi:hypothetical protein